MPNSTSAHESYREASVSTDRATNRSQASLASGLDRCVADYAGLAVLTTFAFGVGMGLLLSKSSRPRRYQRPQSYLAASREQAEEVAQRILAGLSRAVPEGTRRRLHL